MKSSGLDLRATAGALLGGVLLGFLIGWILSLGSDEPSPTPAPAERASTGGPPKGLRDRDVLRMLGAAVDQAAKAGHQLQIGMWVSGGREVAVGSQAQAQMPAGGLLRVATAVAALEGAGAKDRSLAASVQESLLNADDCAQRRVLLALRQTSGDTNAVAQRVQDVLQRANDATATITAGEAPMPATCLAAARVSQKPSPAASKKPRPTPSPAPGEPVPTLDQSAWTLSSALALAHALSAGTYGDAGTTVTRTLRRKRDDDWGAGKAFARFKPAYASAQSDSSAAGAGQLAVFKVAGSDVALVAVLTSPDAGGDVHAALEAAFSEVTDRLEAVRAQ